MTAFKNTLLFLIIFNLIGCGKNQESVEHKLEQNKEPNYDQMDTIKPEETQKKATLFETPEDSINAVKGSILRNQKIKKKKQDTESETDETNSTAVSKTNTTTSNKPTVIKTKVPSFVYIKKILRECEVGVVMTPEYLQTHYNIPKEAIQLVKTVTKISDNELDVKWKSTWFIEKMSDAKFHDGRLKVRFDKNKMYTSGEAIGIKYEKKIYTDLYLIGRSAHIPAVKGYYWKIGKE